MSGLNITFDVNGQPESGYLALPSQPDAPGVLVLHAWWGLNSFFKNLCDRLAREGFAAFAPDLNSGRVAKSIEEAKQIMEELPPDRKMAVAAASPGFLRNQPEVHKEPFSIIGFSMGAAHSLVLAEEQSQDIHKVVLFYGSYGDLQYSKATAKILGHFAEVDEWEPADEVNAMENNIRSAGLSAVFYKYPNTSHWFFEEDRSEFNSEAAQLAWSRTVEFLKVK